MKEYRIIMRYENLTKMYKIDSKTNKNVLSVGHAILYPFITISFMKIPLNKVH